MYKRRIALIMQKVHTKDIVDVIGNLFKKEENKYQLRRKSKFILPRLNTELGRRSIRYRGPVIWNSIEEGVKEASYSNFKKQLNQIRLLTSVLRMDQQRFTQLTLAISIFK